MSKSTIQLERIKIIYDLITSSPLTINNIIDELQKYNIICSNRQIYRDLEYLERYYLRQNEKLSIVIGEHNRKTYRLLIDSEEIDLNPRDIVAFQLTRSASPRYLMTNRSDSMQKFRTVYNSFIKKNSAFYTFMQESQNTRSHFYEGINNSEYDDKIDSIIWAISNYKKILIHSIEGDATSSSKKQNSNFLFKSIKLIYHRGNHFIAGFSVPNDDFQIIDISKIISFEITDKSFIYKALIPKADEEINKRFGVTQNIDNKTYDIVLELSSTTGNFMKGYFWHPTQEFIKLPSGNWHLKLHCGINRELIGWIFMWMTNIKICKPIILKNLFNKQLEGITELHKMDKTLKYNNIFK
jgi:predicted DNA-binding transcriptional regulator YafY